MMTKFNVSLPQANEVDSAFDDMFADLPELDPFEIKKKYIAADLTAILAFQGVSKKVLAEKLGWHKSAVTRLFSGKCNPTIKTIWSLSTYLGYDFDITFRKHEQPSHPQPWHACEVTNSSARTHLAAQILHFVEAQTPEQVKCDLSKGIQKGDVYAIFKIPEKSKPKIVASEQFLIQHQPANTVKAYINSSSQRATTVTSS